MAGIRDRGAVRDGSLCSLAAGGHSADAAGPHPCDDPQNTGDGVPAHRHLSAGARCGHLLQRLLLHSGRQRSGAGKRHLHLQDRRGAGRGHCACAGHPPAAETPIKQKRDRPPGGLVGYAGKSGGGNHPQQLGPGGDIQLEVCLVQLGVVGNTDRRFSTVGIDLHQAVAGNGIGGYLDAGNDWLGHHTGGDDLLALYGTALFADDPFNNSGIVECCCHYLFTVLQSSGMNSQVGKVGKDTVYLGQLGVILYLAAFGAKCKGLSGAIGELMLEGGLHTLGLILCRGLPGVFFALGFARGLFGHADHRTARQHADGQTKGGQGFQHTIFHSRILSPRISAGQRGLSLVTFYRCSSLIISIGRKRCQCPGLSPAETFAGRMQRKGGNTRAKCIYTQRMWCCMYKCFQKGFICSDFLHNT